MHDEAKLIQAASLIEDVPDLEVRHREIEKAVRNILIAVGEDPTREGLLKTPERVARAYDELLAGYSVEPRAMINEACFESDVNEMVIVKDIEFYSLCLPSQQLVNAVDGAKPAA